MKILEVTHGFPPLQRGGTENNTYLLSKTLAKNKNLKIYVFSGGLSSKYYQDFKDETIDGINIRRIHSVSLSFLKQDFPNVDIFTYKNTHIEKMFMDYLDNVKPDVVHFQHTIGLSASLIHITLEKNLRPIVTIRDFWYLCPRIKLLTPTGDLCRGPEYGLNCFFCYSKGTLKTKKPTYSKLARQMFSIIKVPVSIKNYIKNRIMAMERYNIGDKYGNALPFFARYYYLKETLQSAKYIISPSLFLKSFYSEKMNIEPSRINFIPHGIVPFKTKRRSKGSIKRPVYFGYAGSPNKYKGAYLLIDVFKQIPPADAKLVIWGRGWEKISEQMKFSKNIIVKGEYSSQDLNKVFSSFDILIIPSTCYETFSFVAHEAFSARIPVIASNIGVFNDIIQDGKNGLLFERNDANSLYNSINKIIENPGLIAKFSKNIRKPKSWDKYVDELYNIYKEASRTMK
ncbi:MAG: hypothetical protein B5M53_00505 [Candidatus Cloacimonas sp. 4484_209]|nr:MAG: hypothetical protein B5M53_00505 [Candidatus Cloacimonas sp. 4484_209]